MTDANISEKQSSLNTMYRLLQELLYVNGRLVKPQIEAPDRSMKLHDESRGLEVCKKITLG